MSEVRRWVTEIRHTDPDTRRRGRVLVVLTLGLEVLAVVYAPLALLQPGGTVVALGFAAVAVVYPVLIGLARAGRVDAAVALLLGAYTAGLLGILLGLGETPAVATLFAVLLVVLACAVLPRRRLPWVVLAALAALVLLPTLTGGRTRAVGYWEMAFYTSLLVLFVGLALAVKARDIDEALRRAVEQSRRAESLAAQLAAANSALEERVRERTHELSRLLASQAAQAEAVATALQEQQRLASQLEDLAARDPLTGLHNRRRFDHALDMLFDGERSTSDGGSLCVAIADIDNFKEVNDRHGHDVGDQVLRRIATIFQAHTRSGDVLVRLGGEEFALLLPDTDAAAAAGVCERIRTEVATCDFADLAPGLQVTLSVGLASDSEGYADPRAQLRAADRRLYQAKRAGKNRTASREERRRRRIEE